MINGGNASIYVSDMDASIDFYTEQIGLRLRTRIENEWAELDAGKGFTIGLHPARPSETAVPGSRGAIDIELNVSSSLDEVVTELTSRKVDFTGPIINYPNVRIVSLFDPDKNVIVLAEVLNS